MRTTIVLDASSAVRIAFQAPDAEASVEALAASARACAPTLFASEAVNAFARHVRSGEVRASEAHAMLRDCLDMVTLLGGDDEFAHRALSTAVDERLSAYGAS